MRSGKYCCSNIILITVGIVALINQANALQAQKLSDAKIFEPTRLLDIRIELPDTDWQAVRRQTRRFGGSMSNLSEKPFNYFRGTVSIDGTKISSVGIRRKGLFGSHNNESNSRWSQDASPLRVR